MPTQKKSLVKKKTKVAKGGKLKSKASKGEKTVNLAVGLGIRKSGGGGVSGQINL